MDDNKPMPYIMLSPVEYAQLEKANYALGYQAATQAAEARYKPVVEAAQAVVDRWHSTDWKAPPTADFMNRLRDALADAARVMKGE